MTDWQFERLGGGKGYKEAVMWNFWAYCSYSGLYEIIGLVQRGLVEHFSLQKEHL